MQQHCACLISDRLWFYSTLHPAGMVPGFPGHGELFPLCALFSHPKCLELHTKSVVVMENLSVELFHKYIFRPSSAKV